MTSRLLLTTLALAFTAQAQDHPPAIHFIKTGLFMISGTDGNTVVRLSGNGMILVDGQGPGHYAPLVSAARKIADELPIRVLINTDQAPIHTGTNADFLKAGIPVIAHENVLKNLAAHPSPDGTPAAPSATFESVRTLHLGGVSVQLLHYGAAHTNGDTVVYFPDLKVVAVGDLVGAPLRTGEGGSLTGWGSVLGQILTLDFDTVVPGQGPLLSRADLASFKARIDSLQPESDHP